MSATTATPKTEDANDEYDFGDRKTKFMAGLNLAEARRKREEGTTKLRKDKKDSAFNQRRKRTMQFGANTLSKGTPDGDESDNQFLHKDKDVNASLMEKFKSMKESINLETAENDDDKTSFYATEMFRKYLSAEENPPIREVIACGVVPILIKLLALNENPAIQYEASWALTNLASGTSEDTKVLVKNGIVPQLIQLLASKHAELREQALWVLGNLAGDSLECRNLTLESNLVKSLVDHLREAKAKYSFIQVSAWTFSNLFRGKPQAPLDQMIMSIPILASFLAVQDEEILTDTCWAISYITDASNEAIDNVLKTTIAPRLIQLMGHRLLTIRVPALRAAGNILTGTHEHTSIMINEGMLDALAKSLTSDNKKLVKESCWGVSNITAGTVDQISAVLHNSDLLTELLNQCENEDLEIQREAVWAVANATSGGTVSQTFSLIHRGVLSTLDIIIERQDPKLILLILDTVGNILEAGALYKKYSDVDENICATQVDKMGFLSKIEDLQAHPNQEIYDKVIELIEGFYEHDTIEEGTETKPVISEFDV